MPRAKITANRERNPDGFLNKENLHIYTWDTVRKYLNTHTLNETRRLYRFPDGFILGNLKQARLQQAQPKSRRKRPEQEQEQELYMPAFNTQTHYQITIKYRIIYRANDREYIQECMRGLSSYGDNIEDDVQFIINETTHYLQENYNTLADVVFESYKIEETRSRVAEQDLALVRMREIGAVRIESVNVIHFEPTEINQCVPEYLHSIYNIPIDTIKSICGWDYDDQGVNSLMVQKFCDEYKINHYALDINMKIIRRTIGKYDHHKNRPALIYIIENNHMYPVHDKGARKTIVEASKEREVHILRRDDIAESNDMKREEALSNTNVIHGNLSFEQVESLTGQTIVIYSDHIALTNIFNTALKNNIVFDPVHRHGGLDEVRIFRGGSLIRLIYRPSTGLIEKLCKSEALPHYYQSETKVVSSLFDKFQGLNKYKRNVSAKMKEQIRENQICKCLLCKADINEDFEVDHIHPLYMGGNNQEDNLQALCKDCHSEKTLLDLFGDSMRHSTFSEQTFKIFMEKPLKRSFIYNFREISKKAQYIGKYDINKCYRQCLYNGPRYGFPIFTPFDEVQPYTGEPLQAGFYFVESSNFLPLRGNSWVIPDVIEYARSQKIPFHITHQLIASRTLSKKFYRGFIDYVLETCKKADTQDLGKILINTFIGKLGQRIKHSDKRFYVSTFESASRLYEHGFISQREGVKLFEVINHNDKPVHFSNVPIYATVMDLSFIMVHQLKNILSKQGGTALMVDTDAIFCEFSEQPNQFLNSDWFKCEGIYSRNNLPEKWNKKLSKSKSNCWNRYMSKESFISESKDWHEYSADSTIERCIQRMEKGIFLNGEGGCGKTYLIQKFMEKNGGESEVYSPTWKAARKLGGNSLFSLFANIKNKNKTMKAVKWVIIDEISMMSQNYYHLLLMLMKENKQLRLILSGDFNQLPPVKEKKRNTCLALWDLVHGRKMIFPNNYRCDRDLLADCRRLTYEQINIDTYGQNRETQIHLCKSNQLRKGLNTKLNKDVLNFIEIQATRNRYTQPMKIAKGVPLIAYKTNEDMGIFNSETWTVQRVNFKDASKKSAHIFLKHTMTGKVVEFSKTDIQNNFLLGYAITIHKAQGDTISEPYTIWEWIHMSRESQYVALSRGAKKEFVNIIRE